MINHIFERNKLIEQHISQAKRDELEARALLHDANIEYEKFQNQISSQKSETAENTENVGVDGTAVTVVQASDWVKKVNSQNLTKVLITFVYNFLNI